MTESNDNGSYRWVVLGIIMIGTFMAILDSSIVNVALPDMMSAFGVNRNQIEWVATGFMLATAVAMPLVGWLVKRLGHKVLYITSLALFTAGSAACALAWSYDSLIFARIVQAVGGGAIQPVGMAIIADLFAPHERGKALGIWGTGIMIGPAVGPTLGGYLTEWSSWRAIFSVNLPIGVLALFAASTIMRKEDVTSNRKTPFDWWGFIFLSMALISGLLALSKGQDKGWTSSYTYTNLAIAIVGFVMFIAVERTIEHPLLDLSLFKYHNYSLSMVLAIFRSVGLFGGVFLLPIFLENLVGYTTIQTGLWMMPGAIAVGIMMPISGKMADLYSPKWLVGAGTLVTGFSLLLYGNLDPLSGATMIIGPQLIRGVGLALMMAPLITAAINAVPNDQVATASSFLNVAQRLGGSFGIALLNTYVTNTIRSHSVRMGSLLGTESDTFQHLVHHLSGLTLRSTPGMILGDQTKGALLAAQAIMQRASVMGFENGFTLAGWIVFAGFPLAMWLKGKSSQDGGLKAPGGKR